MKIAAFDYETFYSKEYSVRTLGNWHYTHQPDFDAYLLSVAGDDGFEWVGHPSEFDWNLFYGITLLSHNAGFELAVTRRLQELNIIPVIFGSPEEPELYDTADLAAYLGSPRSLAESASFLLGETADKTMRDKARGKHWNDMTPDVQALMKQYALTDSKLTLQLWLKYNHLWPEWEREISKYTREMCSEGLPVNIEKVKQAVHSLEKRLVNARLLIPWAEDEDSPVLSLKQAAAESRKHGIIPPKSFAKDSEEFEEWLSKYGEKFPWASALGEYRSVNMLHKKLCVLRDRINDKGKFCYGLKYFGAHTGRDSGEGGFNTQNPARKPMHGVDVRSCMITAPPGYTLIIADESAVEPRTTALLCEDWELVKMMKEGMDVYEAQARARGQYTDARPLKVVDPKLRHFKKVEVLACTYGAGPDKARIIAKQQGGIDMTLEEAEDMVRQFRTRKFIPNMWKTLETACKKSAPGEFTMELPSGRIMTYREVKAFGSVSAVIPRMGKMMRVKLWGGTLLENIVQAAARDIFMWHVRQIRLELGLSAILRCHDEGVWLVKEDEAEDRLKDILQVMHTPPTWWADFPAGAEGAISNVYTKI
jgi:DNA polymerase bacteriophage-type